MGLCQPFGWVVFFAAPLVLWILVAWLSKKGEDAKLLSIVAGHDGRLSLSRLQAGLWTMLIFASYSAAMAVHPAIKIVSAEQKDAAQKAYEATVTVQKTAEQALDQANLLLAQKTAQAAGLTGDPAKVANDAIRLQQNAVNSAKDDLSKKKSNSEAKLRDWRQTKWIVIPAELLALAGISLASGVFASVISATNDAGTPPAVNAAAVAKAAGDLLLTVTGTGFDTTGSLRLNNTPVKTTKWSDVSITASIQNVATYKRLTVDTSNGKVTYQLKYGMAGDVSTLTLGESELDYEWSDLFRDDTSPATMSLTKVQMFGWTVIGLVFYAVIFLRNFSGSIDSLPIVDSSIVLLTGLSQSGYLGGKAAANAK